MSIFIRSYEIMENTDKEKRIKKEINKYKKICKDVDENQQKLAEKLIENAAFMAILLQDLQTDINENGITEKYSNGSNQSGVRISAATKVYNSLIKNYNQTIKQIADILNVSVDAFQDDGFEAFLKMK